MIDIETGLDLLNRDKNLNFLISKFGKPDFDFKEDYFQSLVRSIVYQQLSGKSAKAIHERFIDLLPMNSLLAPKEVLKLDKNDIRNTGI